MKYYLETNGLICASRQLTETKVASACFVSILGLLELITDLDDNVFGSKKTAIRRILESKVQIDWRLPQQIILDAFGIRAVYAITESNTRMVMHAMIKANNKHEFIDAIRQTGLDQIYKEMEEYDSHYNRSLPAQLDDMAKNIEISGLSGAAQTALSYLEQSNDNKSDSFSLEVRTEMIRIIVEKMADDIAASRFNCEKLLPCQLLTSYDGRLDIFLGVLFLYSFKKVSLKGKAGRNDITDLYHLVYLEDDDIIVSDDNLLRRALGAYLPQSIWTCSDFKTWIETN
jgi:hypothetical protein